MCTPDRARPGQERRVREGGRRPREDGADAGRLHDVGEGADDLDPAALVDLRVAADRGELVVADVLEPGPPGSVGSQTETPASAC